MRKLLLIAFSLFHFCVLAQAEKQYQIRTVAFYNLENLFDTENDTLIFDDDRTPEGKDNWTLKRYNKKLDHLTRVLSEIGSEVTKTSPDIIGVCEVENLSVIEDLVNHGNLIDKQYGIVHFDSPDERGIDVALLYKKDVFLPTSFASHRLLLFDDEDHRNYTRDQLLVGGYLDNEPYYFMVNHWPSRSGGEARSRPNRIAAAKLSRRIIDSIQRLNADAKIIGMGDFNDDPIDYSFKKVLKTKGEIEDVLAAEEYQITENPVHENSTANLAVNDASDSQEIVTKQTNPTRNQSINSVVHPERIGLYNPMEKLYRKGIGSLAYRDKWNLFDQIYFTENIIAPPVGTYRFWKAGVFNRPYLISKKGRFKGYPFRTYAGGSYTGGYSDHFPVFMYLIREVSPVSEKKEN